MVPSLKLPLAALSVVLPLLSLPSRSAWAQSPEAQCEAVQQTESMRAAGQYRAARALLLECVNAQCGGDVRRRCAAMLQKVEAVTPSIVVRAQLANGDDATDVSVSLGDEQLSSSLDGIAIPVDPGEHRLVLQRPGHAPVSQVLNIREGEKFRAVDVMLEPSALSGGTASSSSVSSVSNFDGRLAAGGTLIGVGVVGLASFTLLGLKARSDESDLKACKPFCSKAQGDSVLARYWMANISAGVGVLALGAATWLLLSGPSQPSSPVSDLAGLSIVAGSDGAFAAYEHQF
ncbi:MAG: hypothetical protein RL685_2402 [Pseudomonadota bacterium]